VKSDVADIYAVAFILNYEVLNDAPGSEAGLDHDGVTQVVPRSLGVGQHHDGAPTINEQRANPDVTRGPADGVEEPVGVDSFAVRVDEDDAMRALEVVALELRASERTLVTGPAQELLDQIPTEAELGLLEAAQTRQLHREHRGAVLERDLFGHARA